VFRVRHALAYAVHKFFNDKGFVYMHTPVITGSDAEGAGELFKVTTLPLIIHHAMMMAVLISKKIFLAVLLT
jgi:aspartyl/asparaginyl-tRNA synthetase